MAREIERKYLVDVTTWAPQGDGVRIEQGYLCSVKERVVRVRIEGTAATLTIKGLTTGITRAEYEYAIPLDDAAAMLASLCERPLIEKHRHREIQVILPPWARAEVSEDPRYYNASLLTHPYSRWRQGT